MALARILLLLAGLVVGLAAVPTALGAAVVAPDQPPAKKLDEAPPEVWIFTGVLPVSHESVSGTIAGTDDRTDFEMKLSGGATCDSSKTVDGVGIVRLPSFPCSDKRSLQAVFVPQGGPHLKVVGYLDGEEFSFDAYRLEDPRDGASSDPGGHILPPAPSAQ